MDFLLSPFIKIPVVAVIVSADVAVRCSIWFPTDSCTLVYTYRYTHVLYYGAQTMCAQATLSSI